MATQSTEGDQEDARISKTEKLRKLSCAHSFVFILIFDLFVFLSSHPSSSSSPTLSHTNSRFLVSFFLNSLATINLLFFMLHTKIVGNEREVLRSHNDFITRSLQSLYSFFFFLIFPESIHHSINE